MMTAEVLWGVGFPLVVVVGYGVSCWLWPMTTCSRERCEGGRIYREPDRRVWRDCRRCKGSGKRIRVGRRVFNWWHARHRETR